MSEKQYQLLGAAQGFVLAMKGGEILWVKQQPRLSPIVGYTKE